MRGYLVAFPLVVILALVGVALALAADGYDLGWHSVDGGGATFSKRDGYALAGTMGQPDAGLLTGGKYTLGGGLWGGGVVVGIVYDVHLPLVLRQ